MKKFVMYHSGGIEFANEESELPATHVIIDGKIVDRREAFYDYVAKAWKRTAPFIEEWRASNL
jgi:hypothetical protein